MQSSYWRIHYRSKSYDEDTDRVAHAIDKTLKRCKLEGFVEYALLYIVNSEDAANGVFTQPSAEPDDWKDVVALVKTRNDTTLWNLRMVLKLSYKEHESLFANDCRYEPLSQAQIEQLIQECEGGRL